MTDLPQHVQDVIDAALEWSDSFRSALKFWEEQRLQEAVDAYRKAETPEPFEVNMTVYADGSKRIPQGEIPEFPPSSVWRVTVTPVERVR